MQQYGLTFGFREPYQVLGERLLRTLGCRSFADIWTYAVDAQMIQDADRFQMDLVGGLERTLHGKIKPSMSELALPLRSVAEFK